MTSLITVQLCPRSCSQVHLRRHEEGVQHNELRPVWAGVHDECVLLGLNVYLITHWECTGADDGARGTVEMLFCTSLLALVGAADHPQSSPRKLQIVNTKVCNSAWYSLPDTRHVRSHILQRRLEQRAHPE